MVATPDGHLLLAGGASGAVAVYKLRADGSLALDFGTQGIATVDLGDEDVASGIVLTPTGRIVVSAVRSSDDAVEGGALIGLTGEGELDPTFGDGGITATSAGLIDLNEDVEGRFVAAGAGNESAASVLRFDASGVLDPTFGVGGVALIEIGEDATISGLTTSADAGVVLVGERLLQDDSTDPFVARLDPDGRPDAAFGTRGVLQLDFDGSLSVLTGVTVDTEGRIVSAGLDVDERAQTGALVLVRVTPDGSLDTTFGDGGLVTERFGQQYAGATDLAIQPDGRVVVSGVSESSGRTQMLVSRFRPDGSVDTGFGTGGAALLGPSGGADFYGAYGLALQPDDRIVAVGYGVDAGRDDEPPTSLVAIRLFGSIGVAVGPAPEPPGLDLRLLGPTPGPLPPQASLVLSAPRSVRVTVYDPTGRTIADLHDGPLAAGPHRFRIERDLSAGVYLVHAQTGDGRSAVASFVIAR